MNIFVTGNVKEYVLNVNVNLWYMKYIVVKKLESQVKEGCI